MPFRSPTLVALPLLVLLGGNAVAQGWDPEDGLVLQGNLVTMNETLEVVPDGRLVILGDRIVAVLRPGEPLPNSVDLSRAIIVETGGWIYPGLIDSHNHITYNVLPLYEVPERYSNRYQWTRPASYKRHVNTPERLLTEKAFYDLAAEVVKYAEVQAIAGGVTSIQGSPNLTATRLLVRNIEHFNFGQDRIYQRTLAITDSRFDAAGLLQTMTEGKVDAWLVHLAEGVDSMSRAEFDILKSVDLVGDMTVIIHGTALLPSHFQEMAEKGTKLVWSPLSNLLLYGATTNIPAAIDAGVVVALGSDWGPSGSKNLLGELKVADGVDRTRFGDVISDTLLVQMVTSAPAFALGLDDKIGQLRPGLYADVVVFETVDANPYQSLIQSNERHVRLVLIGGEPLYGDREIMEQLKPGDYEVLVADGAEKGLDITNSDVTKGSQTFAEIRQLLEQAMRFDLEHMWETFGGTMELEEFQAFLDERFGTGIIPKPLDPIFAFEDTLFFGAIGSSVNASLAFDLPSFWPTSVHPPMVDPVLAFINSADASFETLDIAVALDRRAAEGIVAHRDGPDGQRGTSDDNPFDNLQELDAVPYVGRSALEKLRTYVVGARGTDARVLAFINSSHVTFELLDREVALGRRAAEGIIRHRDGLDGRFGTADDNLFDSIEELDAVPFVGPATLERLRTYVAAR